MIRRYEGLHLKLLLLLGVFLTLISPPAHAAGSAALPEGLVAPNQSTSMPEFELSDANGETLRSAALQGKVVVVRFWATW
jgi:cytochrome oxidase Cu insertion factor (SCO1/SenC/PrrC family)